MRVSKPIILHLPDLFVKKLDKYLKENLQTFKIQRVYFYYVMNHLTLMQIQHKNDEYISLNITYLKSITTSNIGRYVSILRKGEFIISDGIYTPGVKSLMYKINPKLMKGICKVELIQNSKLSKSIINKLYQKKAHYNRLEPHLKLMRCEFVKMELDYAKANKWIEDNADDAHELNYITSLSNIEDKRFRYFKRNKTNKRLDTNLTNLKSDLRQFIKGDYVNIDLKNSQPFLLSILIDSIINKRDTLCCYLQESFLNKTFGIKVIKNILLTHQKQEKEEMVKLIPFFNSVLRGTLYDEFINSYSAKLDRKKAKNIVFKVLFSRNEYCTNYKKFTPYKEDKMVFASVYPSVYKIVKELKNKDHRILPIYLQQLESYLFIDCIAKELVKNEIIPLTIHDSFIVPTKDKERALAIIKMVLLKEIGVVPTFKIESLQPVEKFIKQRHLKIAI